ncbi:MAG: DUF2075 domain-containing protein [Methylotenera sp.]|nr:DUF2075 domain-containing protein [Flavobacterium sp.]
MTTRFVYPYNSMQKYLRNAYRVLMTRARQGFIIDIPHGNVQN